MIFGILACSDDSSSNATTKPTEDNELKEVSTIYDLGACLAERENKVVFVIEENADYICRNSKWINITNYENENSSSNVESSSSETKNSSSNVEPSSSKNESSSSSVKSSSSNKESSSSSAEPSSSETKNSSSNIESSSSNKENSSSSVNSSSSNKENSSSSVKSSSSKNESSSSSVKSSSSINTSSSIIEYADIKPSGYYKDNCPSGKTCTYVDTTYLNQQFLSENKYGEFLDERDYQVYKTIQIKSQVWMAQNLNYRSVFVRSGKAVADSGSSCYEDRYSSPNCDDEYGRYYTWAAAMDSINQGGCGYNKECSPQQPHRGVCPEGWHIPSQSDWKDLEKVKYRYMGEQMKTTTGWYNNKNGDNSSGFSALPAGQAYFDYDIYLRYHEHQYQYAYFWSSSEANQKQAFHVKLKYTEDDINIIDDPYFGMFKNYELSVRCIKNNE